MKITGASAAAFCSMRPSNSADKLIAHLRESPGVEKVTPAGSLRRGRETVGDLDILVTGKGCCDQTKRARKLSSTCCAFPA